MFNNDFEDARKWRTILSAVMSEMPLRKGVLDLEENAPGHGHRVPGIWDADNGDKAGKPCAWCAVWNLARKELGKGTA